MLTSLERVSLFRSISGLRALNLGMDPLTEARPKGVITPESGRARAEVTPPLPPSGVETAAVGTPAWGWG